MPIGAAHVRTNSKILKVVKLQQETLGDEVGTAPEDSRGLMGGVAVLGLSAADGGAD